MPARRMTPADRMPVLVGELNPYGADHFFALYCEPPTSSGGRLQRRVMALPRRQYLSFPRYNLFEALREWDDEHLAAWQHWAGGGRGRPAGGTRLPLPPERF